MSRIPLALAVCTLLITGSALAQHSGMANMGGMAGIDQGLTDAMTRMDNGMPKQSSGSVDTDFVRMMIPHHQGAVDMAKVELAKGKDPQMRALARKIIAAQRREIAQMQAWLKKHPGK